MCRCDVVSVERSAAFDDRCVDARALGAVAGARLLSMRCRKVGQRICTSSSQGLDVVCNE